MAEVIGESIDRVATIEIRTQAPPRGVISKLYESARKKSQYPLTLTAARELVSAVKANDHVFFLTGAGGAPSLPLGENDGPPGAASLARALALGIGAKPIYLSDECFLEPIIAASEGAGISVRGVDREMLKVRPNAGIAMAFPLDPSEASLRARELLDSYRPTAVIAVERLGPNEKGVFHSMGGFSVSCAPLDVLITEAQRRNILTVGIGDNGNEIGSGAIHSEAKSIQPWGRECRCACKSGIVSVTKTDVFVLASVSNWGAYGVSACLAYLLGDLDILHNPDLERRMIEACVERGAVDGDLGMQLLSVDGISLEVQQSVVRIMQEIVKLGLGKRMEITYT